VDADALGDAREPIVHEDIGRAVGIVWHEVGGARHERDITAVAADRRSGQDTAVAVALVAAAADAHAFRDRRRAVVDKDIGDAIGIVRHQVRGPGHEWDRAPVGADSGTEAAAVRGVAAGADAQQGRDPAGVRSAVEHDDQCPSEYDRNASRHDVPGYPRVAYATRSSLRASTTERAPGPCGCEGRRTGDVNRGDPRRPYQQCSRLTRRCKYSKPSTYL